MKRRFFKNSVTRRILRGAMGFGAIITAAALLFAACDTPVNNNNNNNNEEQEDEQEDEVVTVEYTITPTASSNGRIIATPEKAAEGTEITLALIPNVYYSLAAAPQVALADGTAVPLTEKEETEPYTFAMPAADVTVSASFAINAAHNDIPLYSAADLAKIGVDPAYPMNGVYKLEADIAVDNWMPIGEFPGKPFTGILRGNNKTITINSFSEEGLAKQAAGLFGYTAFAEMENLAVRAELDAITLEATGTVSFGVVIGNSLNVNLKNINASGKINKVESTGTLAAGGMVGLLSSGKIEASRVAIEMSGSATGYTYIGGITGYIFAYNTTITPSAGVIISDCSFEGSIEGISTGLYADAGGIVGSGGSYKNVSINRCQVEGNITASGGTSRSSAGGIAGYGVPIEDCSFDEGLVTASGSTTVNYAGGIIGSGGAITRCTSAGDVIASFDGTASSGTFGVYAGGISGSNSSSIQYCSASGDVRAHNTGTITTYSRNRTSAGGISGQNTGSITQCYATGDVESLFSGDTTSLRAANMDYVVAGGITGLTGDTSGTSQGIISDCYYEGGEIIAEGNYAHAGGITGLVQGKTDETRVSKSYARGVISAKGYGQFNEATTYMGVYVYKRNAAGGIAGSAPTGTANTTIPAIENCVALAEALTVAGPKATEGGRAEDFYIKSGRIAGTNAGAASGSGYTVPGSFSGALTNNAANSAMTITRILTGGATTGPETVTDASSDPENTIDGLGVSIPPAQEVYTDLGWDFDAVWAMGAGGYPVLRQN
jgi:hypothetical protein